MPASVKSGLTRRPGLRTWPDSAHNPGDSPRTPPAAAAAPSRGRGAHRTAGDGGARRRRPRTGGGQRGAEHGAPRRAAAGGLRQVSHPGTRLALGFLAFVLAGWGAGELWLSIVGSSGELDAVRDIAAQRTAALTDIARAVTWAGSALVLVPLALICCLALVRAGLRAEAFAVALSLGGAMLLSDLLKLLVSRPRPPVEHLQGVSGSSFPSGHATQASAFWFSLVLALRAAGTPRILTGVAAALSLVLVLAVAASRVYLGVHYPGDVVAGVLLGAGWTAYVWRSLREAAVR